MIFSEQPSTPILGILQALALPTVRVSNLFSLQRLSDARMGVNFGLDRVPYGGFNPFNKGRTDARKPGLAGAIEAGLAREIKGCLLDL